MARDQFTYPSMSDKPEESSQIEKAESKRFNYPTMGDKTDEGRKVPGGVEKEAREELSPVDGGSFSYPKMGEQKKAEDAAFKKSHPGLRPHAQPDNLFYYSSLDKELQDKDDSDPDDPYPDDPDDLNDPQGDADELELIELAESGQVDEFANRISEDLLEMGASQKDLDMVDYFREIADGNDPAWQKWGRDMALWIRQSKKAMGK